MLMNSESQTQSVHGKGFLKQEEAQESHGIYCTGFPVIK
jgi:hypothetical protein